VVKAAVANTTAFGEHHHRPIAWKRTNVEEMAIIYKIRRRGRKFSDALHGRQRSNEFGFDDAIIED